jgi:hypothetical protein
MSAVSAMTHGSGIRRINRIDYFLLNIGGIIGVTGCGLRVTGLCVSGHWFLVTGKGKHR